VCDEGLKKRFWVLVKIWVRLNFEKSEKNERKIWDGFFGLSCCLLSLGFWAAKIYPLNREKLGFEGGKGGHQERVKEGNQVCDILWFLVAHESFILVMRWRVVEYSSDGVRWKWVETLGIFLVLGILMVLGVLAHK
jgi:hypothetical protein